MVSLSITSRLPVSITMQFYRLLHTVQNLSTYTKQQRKKQLVQKYTLFNLKIRQILTEIVHIASSIKRKSFVNKLATNAFKTFCKYNFGMHCFIFNISIMHIFCLVTNNLLILSIILVKNIVGLFYLISNIELEISFD